MDEDFTADLDFGGSDTTAAAPAAETASPAPSAGTEGTAGGAAPEQDTGESILDDMLGDIRSALTDSDDDTEAPTDAQREAAAEKTGEEEEREQVDEGEGTEKEAGEKEKTPPAEGARTREFQITAPDGSDVTAQLPTGAKFRFKVDGEMVERSVDQLVADASFGAHAQPKLSKMGQDLRGERIRRERAEGKADTLATQLRTQEEKAMSLIEDALTGGLDAEKADKVLAAIEKYRERQADPEWQEAQAARERELAAAEEKEVEQQLTTSTAEETWTFFWQSAVPQEFNAALATQEFPYIRETDLPAIIEDYYGLYETVHGRAVEHFKGKGVAEETAVLMAREVAAGYLTEDHLRASMKRLNDSYAERIGPVETTTRQTKEREAAAKHNAETERRLSRQEDSVRALGAGAVKGGAPGGGAAAEKAPDSFSGVLDSLEDDFAALAGGR